MLSKRLSLERLIRLIDKKKKKNERISLSVPSSSILKGEQCRWPGLDFQRLSTPYRIEKLSRYLPDSKWSADSRPRRTRRELKNSWHSVARFLPPHQSAAHAFLGGAVKCPPISETRLPDVTYWQVAQERTANGIARDIEGARAAISPPSFSLFSREGRKEGRRRRGGEEYLCKGSEGRKERSRSGRSDLWRRSRGRNHVGSPGSRGSERALSGPVAAGTGPTDSYCYYGEWRPTILACLCVQIRGGLGDENRGWSRIKERPSQSSTGSRAPPHRTDLFFRSIPREWTGRGRRRGSLHQWRRRFWWLCVLRLIARLAGRWIVEERRGEESRGVRTSDWPLTNP